MTKRTLIQLQKVADLINKYYEPFCLRHCYREVWRKYVYPEIGLSYRMYKIYVKRAKEAKLIKSKGEY